MNKVYIENSSMSYEYLFSRLGYSVTRDVSKADFICFTGGEDVSPYIYEDATHPSTYANAFRDQKEARLFKEIREQRKPAVGICRGGQFLNVMNGGRMYQHVTNHTGDHYIETSMVDTPILVSSTHHQMMMPTEDAQILAVAYVESKREWCDGDSYGIKKDVSDVGIEVVWYPNHQSLCFQPHPEFTEKKYEGMTDYFHQLLKEYIGF